jgi:ParB/RepB/Spo0J family partition protein
LVAQSSFEERIMAGSNNQKTAMIDLADIRENPSALRGVNRQSEDYQGLVDSIRLKGVINAISVREQKVDDKVYYGLIDGLHRFTAAADAGLKKIPATITPMDDAEALEAQIMANLHKIETKPIEYTKQLMRLLSGNPTMTVSELAGKLAKSNTWLSERLGLIKLDEKVAGLVDEGKINLSNAYALAKLPADEQASFVERAITQSPQEFIPSVNSRVKELRDAKRQGRDPNKPDFIPFPHLRRVAEIKQEMENPRVGPAIIRELKPQTLEEAFLFGIQWTLHMDPLSIEEDRRKDTDRRAQEAAEREKRNAEKAVKRAQEAREAQLRAEEATSAA